MAQVRHVVSIDEELIPIIRKLGKVENRNPSNMFETLIREALLARDKQLVTIEHIAGHMEDDDG